MASATAVEPLPSEGHFDAVVRGRPSVRPASSRSAGPRPLYPEPTARAATLRRAGGLRPGRPHPSGVGRGSRSPAHTHQPLATSAAPATAEPLLEHWLLDLRAGPLPRQAYALPALRLARHRDLIDRTRPSGCWSCSPTSTRSTAAPACRARDPLAPRPGRPGPDPDPRPRCDRLHHLSRRPRQRRLSLT